MAQAARDLGYDYLSISEHSQAVSVARGLDEKRLRRHLEAIDRLNETFRDFRLLKAIEVDILEDGSLDLPDAVLRELDFTVCAIHARFDLPEKKQTERIIRAMDNRCFNILAHPTGRLIGERDPYEVDLEKVMVAALERGCYLEVNAHPDRLDLTDVHCHMAKDWGSRWPFPPTLTSPATSATCASASARPAVAGWRRTTCSTRARWRSC
jgi:DNA polymerase (family 10)